MAEENLKDFTINWIITGFLFSCLISFAVVFMFHNSTVGLDPDSNSVFQSSLANYNTSLQESLNDSDVLLNISANTNPEISQLGDRDIVSSTFTAKDSPKQKWEYTKYLISWIFSGDTGSMLITLISTIMGFLAFYYGMKFIRSGS